MNEPEVIVRVEGAVGRLTLNRPQALGALTAGMVDLMTDALLAWRDDSAVSAVLIDHAGERGFCAGGDIRSLADSAAVGGATAKRFFFTEYQLNHLMFVYPKPIITLMDGVTMGGGVGISLPARYRIATERTTFAMPETGIGLFPDVGGGWFLPRLHGSVGVWMALTGARLKAAGCEILGIATDVVPAASLPALKARLIADPEAIETVLTELDSDPGRSAMIEHHDHIDRLFGGATVEAILAALDADGSDWARAQAAIVRTKSPLSLKVALRQLRAGGAMTDFSHVMAMENRIAARLVMAPDFSEGVRAVIVEKDNAPVWSPAALEGVTDAMLDAVFAPLPAQEEWTPMSYDTILVEEKGAVTWITLNRPQALNALNSQVLADLLTAFARFDADPAQRCAVLTGSERAFAAGADIKEMSEQSFADMYGANFFAGYERLTATRKPWLAAVAGYALGGGCELAMMADFIIAADNAKFGQPEIKLAVTPGMGGSQRLTRAVGKAKAMEMCLTGRNMDAKEAEAAGLVARVVPLADLAAEALKSAEAVAAMAPLAAMAAKEMVNAAFETTLAQGVAFERRLFHGLFGTADQTEGMAAFIEKRPGVFTGQ